ncbi:MAG TPA: hypothetical protein VG817_11800, partial [Gemmatimonadales bacterium]|nr:hypothetical protein [Gemmatimonadales bacterium]
WLDQVLDDLVNLGFFAAASWVLWREGSTVAMVIGVVGVTTHLLYQVALYAALITRGGGSGSVTSIQWRSTRPVNASHRIDTRTPFMVVKEIVEIAGRRDFFTFFYIPMILIGLPEIALAWCAIIFAVSGLAITYEWLAYGGPSPAPRG